MKITQQNIHCRPGNLQLLPLHTTDAYNRGVTQSTRTMTKQTNADRFGVSIVEEKRGSFGRLITELLRASTYVRRARWLWFFCTFQNYLYHSMHAPAITPPLLKDVLLFLSDFFLAHVREELWKETIFAHSFGFGSLTTVSDISLQE